jgi:exosortase/archaeosortase family protein
VSDTHSHSISSIHQRPWWLNLLVFMGSFALLQYGWEMARNSALERLVVHQVTVNTTATLIRLISPDIHAQPVGANIVASGGGLHVMRGCEGVEVMFVLAAALLAHPFAWRVKCAGLAGGLALIFVLNEARLLALFYSYRYSHALFDQLHGLVTPLLMMAAVVLFFLSLLHWQDQPSQQA